MSWYSHHMLPGHQSLLDFIHGIHIKTRHKCMITTIYGKRFQFLNDNIVLINASQRQGKSVAEAAAMRPKRWISRSELERSQEAD